MGSAENTLLPGPLARQRAVELVAVARVLIASCEQECECSAALIRQARDARAL
jgi:hypothetical protein